MADLIARLEAAEEGSRELSDEVLLAAGWSRAEILQPGQTGWLMPDGKPLYSTHPHLFGAPEVTQSLDAALTLVNERFSWTVYSAYDEFSPRAVVSGGAVQMSGVARTPALALCIAALKAREHSNG